MATILEAVYPYTYTDDDGSDISFREGDRFLLIERSSDDWWRVQRTGVFSGKSVCFVPASYMEEKDFTHKGSERATNHYVNLQVFQKIVEKDFDGLAKLDKKSLVVSKDSSDDLPSPTTPDSSYESSPEVRISPIGVTPSLPPVNREKSSTLPSGWRKYRDDSGRSYYYNEDNKESKWKPPRPSISDEISDTEESWDEETTYLERRQSVDDHLQKRMEREAKQQGHKSNTIQYNRSTSVNNDVLPPTPTTPSSRLSYDSNVSKEGNLHRQKLQEGGKYIKKPTWQQIYCCVIGSSLVFYKDAKTANPKTAYPSGKPESSFDLRGASLDPVTKEKSSGKKHVFQLSSYQKQSIQLLSSDNEIDYSEWVKIIHLLIQKLEREDPLPADETPNFDTKFDGPRNLRGGGDRSDTTKSATLPKRLLPSTPSSRASRSFSTSEKDIEKEEKEKEKEKHKEKHKDKEKRFFRRPSSKALHDDDKDKVKIKDKLRRYLLSRPSYNELEAKGIVKDFVFGCPIEKVCEREDTLVPTCIINILNEVEHRGLDLDGIYRVSGNLSSIQKLRVMFDNGEWVDFKKPIWDDTHLLTGALKLYFRELPDPLIPFKLFDKFIDVARIRSRAEQIQVLSSLVKMLPRENKETLNLLISHLQRVSTYSSMNRMDANNLSIVFGPTLMFPDNQVNTNSMGVTTVYQSRVVEILLMEYNNIFDDCYSNKNSEML